MSEDGADSTPTRDRVAGIYRKRAARYDLTANLYRLVGFRIPAYRRMAVAALKLEAGDTVVDIGCGTGLNFPLIEAAVGARGKVIGVDLTDAMLSQARRRVAQGGWSNVELVQCDAARYAFPPGVDGIISTFAISLMPESDAIVRQGSQALAPGKRWAILDFKLPTNRVARLFTPLGVLLTRPFAGSMEAVERHPWESIERYLVNASRTDFYFGAAYIAVGERGAAGGDAT